MKKKLLASIGIVTSVAVLATALIAVAQTTTPAPTATATASAPQVLNVSAAGNVLLRGTIASITSGVMTVNGWGGVWTVNIPASASIYPVATTNYATQFQVGDFVGVQGTIATGANWTVNATLVRDWTYRAAVTAQVKANVQAAQGIRAEGPRDYIGTASNVSASSLTLTVSNGTVYTVNPSANAEVVNRMWTTLPFTSINNGDNVRVYGVDASGTVTAQIVRDVTIPATSTTK
jgi:hypothetical protein